MPVDAKGQLSPEKLQAMVIRGTIQNYEANQLGSPDPNLLNIVVYHATQVDGFRKGDFGFSDANKDLITRMVLLPLKAVNKDRLKAASTTVQKQIDPNNVAVCFTYEADQVGVAKRTGNLWGIAVMSKESASEFAKGVENDPTLLFSLARVINKGPMNNFDKTPIKINTGPKVLILPNGSVGGDIKTPIKSAGFPQGYIANSQH